MNELEFSWFDGPDCAAEDGVNCVFAGGLPIDIGCAFMIGSPFLAAAVQARTLSLPLESKIVFDRDDSAPLTTVGDDSPPAQRVFSFACGEASRRPARVPLPAASFEASVP